MYYKHRCAYTYTDIPNLSQWNQKGKIVPNCSEAKSGTNMDCMVGAQSTNCGKRMFTLILQKQQIGLQNRGKEMAAIAAKIFVLHNISNNNLNS